MIKAIPSKCLSLNFNVEYEKYVFYLHEIHKKSDIIDYRGVGVINVPANLFKSNESTQVFT